MSVDRFYVYYYDGCCIRYDLPTKDAKDVLFICVLSYFLLEPSPKILSLTYRGITSLFTLWNYKVIDDSYRIPIIFGSTRKLQLSALDISLTLL